MTTLHKAAQQALEALSEVDNCTYINDYGDAALDTAYESGMVYKAIAALRAALAEPAQEPVAWLYGAGVDRTLHWNKPPLYGTPLYTAPPQRKPLAEWQINDLMADIDPEDVCSWSFRQGVYAAEKHHGVKP